MTYPTVLLKEVAEVKLGRQRSPKNHAGEFMRSYVRAANVSWAGVDLSDVKTMNFTDDEMRSYRLEPGDLLLSEASGSASEVGKSAIWEGQITDCGFQNTLIRVRPEGPHPRYLLHYFKYLAQTGQFARASRGVGIFHLGRKALAEWPVPLPPVDEQRRIAELLDASEALCLKRSRALESLDSLAESIFIDMFGDPVRSPRWSLAPLGDMCIGRGEYGALVSSAPASPERPRYLRITDIRADGYLNDERVAPSGPPEGWRAKSLNPGDIVFARSGATVGKSFLVRDDHEPMVFAGYLIRFTPDRHAVVPDYLYHYTRTHAYRRWVQRSATTVAQPNINAKRFGEMLLPLPPLVLQAEFGLAMEQVRSVRQQGSKSLAGLRCLFASLQQRAFRGEL